jgi:PhnB protein
MPVKPIPKGYRTVTPYLTVPGVAKLMEFLRKAFRAKELVRMPRPDGTIMHAEMKIGNSIVMMGEPMPGTDPKPAVLYLYVKDTDKVYKRAMKAGAISVKEPANQFYGDRNAMVNDPCGNMWGIATHVEDVPPEEMAKRAEVAMKQAPPAQGA